VTTVTVAGHFLESQAATVVALFTINAAVVTLYAAAVWSQRQMLYGRPDRRKSLASLRHTIEAGTNERAAAVLFLSTDCDICMNLLKYLETFTQTFKERSVFLVIKGMAIDEDAKFGGARILRTESPGLDVAHAVKRSPTLLLLNRDGSSSAHIGLDASLLALSKLAASEHRFVRPATRPSPETSVA
jgi:hypothetical protein